jgi:anti-sigma factor ChrR (cupin superfamily)
VDPGIRSLKLEDAAIPWVPTRHEGIRWLRLESHADGASAPEDALVLIRMAPGRGYPPHRHVGPEDVLVLRGGYRDEMGVHVEGSFVSYPAGSAHAPVACGDASRGESSENPACILFAIVHGGVENL